MPVKLYALSLSTKHGLRVSNGDKRAVAREIYQDNMGFPVKKLAQYAGVTEKTAKEYVQDILAKYKETRDSIIRRLNLLGWTQEEISDRLKEMFPDGKGISRESVKVFLAENGNDHFLPISSELDKGHSPETIAQRFGLPEILVWAAKLKEPTRPPLNTP